MTDSPNHTPSPIFPATGSTGVLELLALLQGGKAYPDFESLLGAIDKAVVPQPHPSHGLIRVAAASPEIEVANCGFNVKNIMRMMHQAEQKRVNILLLPEMIVPGFTIADLIQQEPLRRSALAGLEAIRLATKSVYKGLLAIGCPIELEGNIYNCAVFMQDGEYLGIVPKSYLAMGGEFDEYRWIKVGRDCKRRTILLNGRQVRMGVDLLFQARDFPGLIVGAEICQDGWVFIPPHRFMALAGAVVILNLSTSDELTGKADYRRDHLVKPHSSQAICCYAYASSGEGESTGDMVPGGHCIISENGTILTEVEPFAEKEPFCYADVDVDHLLFERLCNTSFREQQEQFAAMLDYERIAFVARANTPPADLARFVDAYPFVPQNPYTRNKTCKLITEIQVRGLSKRLKHLNKRYGGIEQMVAALQAENKPVCVLGVSGGLDSTHALNIVLRVFDQLKIPRSLLHCYTMPGFGTTKRTYDNAIRLMDLNGVTRKEVDIRARCLVSWLDEGYKPFGIDLAALRERCQKIVAKKHETQYLTRLRAAAVHANHAKELAQEGAANGEGLTNGEDIDLTAIMLEEFGKLLAELPEGSKDLIFENKQARARTDILMNAGFVIGTGDLSELAVGWCTFNGDHMSMYGVNAGVPKTLVHFLVRWAADYWFTGELQAVLIDVAETEVSPELLPPAKDGRIAQKTNSAIGPADLRDFFLYHQRRWGSSPEKIIYLASFAKFHTPYQWSEIRHWLKVYITRFFEQQFKRSTLPDGPKVGSISLSPRYDWHMPSDASPAMWLAWVTAND
jgi:NAD+ synthase (glutamine-hydrolysing)